MVEQVIDLDNIFASLADPTRRDILARVARAELSVGELVEKYDVSFAAISKHLNVLERAKLITKRREGKKQMVTLAPGALQSADEYLEQYRQTWEQKFNKLDAILKEDQYEPRSQSNQRSRSKNPDSRTRI
jgi:DNA-binding transcriptional ArsR family regulator